jgi:pimeloyl-ACP methyl ester carboxylesterase
MDLLSQDELDDRLELLELLERECQTPLRGPPDDSCPDADPLSLRCPFRARRRGLATGRQDPITPMEEAEYMAKRIPDARLVALPGADHVPWAGDIDPLLGEVEEFVTGDDGRPSLNASSP